MDNIIRKLQTSIFMDEGDINYLDSLAPVIIDPDRERKLFCDFESINKCKAKKLCNALRKLGFDADIDDFDETRVEARKGVSYKNSKYALNLAMYEAWKYSCELTTLMLDQDVISNDKSAIQLN